MQAVRYLCDVGLLLRLINFKLDLLDFGLNFALVVFGSQDIAFEILYFLDLLL